MKSGLQTHLYLYREQTLKPDIKPLMSNLFRGDVSRRQLLTRAGLEIVSATAIGIAESANAQQPEASPPVPPSKAPPSEAPPSPISRGGELPPQIQFPPIQAPTEQETAGPPTALPRERRLGFAIVGLGRLSLEEIMPAFGECKLAKPVALVSGALVGHKPTGWQVGFVLQALDYR